MLHITKAVFLGIDDEVVLFFQPDYEVAGAAIARFEDGKNSNVTLDIKMSGRNCSLKFWLESNSYLYFGPPVSLYGTITGPCYPPPIPGVAH